MKIKNYHCLELLVLDVVATIWAIKVVGKNAIRKEVSRSLDQTLLSTEIVHISKDKKEE